ncbi:carboxyl transferase domain-containing protein [Desulfofustis limnaeus]|jgi:acetyl-CoA carboxylase carboxyl transferase subunit beta|uniref:Acetyl-coenzyme A carboxylase carboxyl transferase subunits beta/alpha n=1 Tax=Desulfofustis limnaeus TaxID=2740163 RepID=A0ABN6M9P8_9BACT|nr:carboxyl transferase domain-containing protein [Desulfofustis limnaeus]MDX9895232.1 carboxyl transferase domain-containing protein [Desulfofustis sp.]BDD88521.1 acetyl-CoA carboxylase carboxyl transferase subunit alpha/beta [Desulfofustis limnaeus]
MKEQLKQLLKIEERINYLNQVKDYSNWGNLDGFKTSCERLKQNVYEYPVDQLWGEVRKLHDSISFLEQRAEEQLTPMERVRIVRNTQRFSLKDILENVYDDYTELGGQEDANIDPAMICAKATLTRKGKKKPYTVTVMVIGQESGHGEEFRNGGSCRPEGNEKALRYMRVAETEGIPIHFYVFTPGSYPVEEYPGAAQQIARNIYAMTKLRVPSVSFISEGGSGGAEAIGLSDYRLMASHGYYSVISPEGAAAIEGRVKEGNKAPAELIELCAERLRLTALDNLNHGIIDRIIQEPPLGARRDDFAFFATLRSEMISATDRVVLSTKSFKSFRTWEIHRRKSKKASEEVDVGVSWDLSRDEVERLLQQRSQKYLAMATHGYQGRPEAQQGLLRQAVVSTEHLYYTLRYDILKNQKRQVRKVLSDVSGEGLVMLKRLTEPLRNAVSFFKERNNKRPSRLITYSGNGQNGSPRPDPLELTDTYTSPLANEDRTVTCPNAAKHGCKDLWVPDLYGEFAGVCETCGHHFPLEYHWYLKNIFDPGSIRFFNAHLTAQNPLGYTGFAERIEAAREKTGRRSSNITFTAAVDGIQIVVAVLYSEFRNGTVGSAEGEKFVQACKLAQRKKRPLLAYVHTTGGIRIQEGTLGVIQMPKCTMAVREYIDSGGLYLVVYDNNSYAGPLASFLGCSPYQFAIRSSRIGFAGPRVIRETTGIDIPPDYHSARNALRRGHIQGIWDRREFRRNLYKALLTMGSPSLYYR